MFGIYSAYWSWNTPKKFGETRLKNWEENGINKSKGNAPLLWRKGRKKGMTYLVDLSNDRLLNKQAYLRNVPFFAFI